MLSFDSVPPPWVLLCTTPGTVQSKSVILNLWIPTPLAKVTSDILHIGYLHHNMLHYSYEEATKIMLWLGSPQHENCVKGSQR